MDFTISADILCELLEVAISMILYTREVYPPTVFQRRKKYNIPVQMSIHPGLSSYISNCIASAKPVLETGDVEKVVLAIISEDEKPIEKFVFEITQTPIKPLNIKEDPLFSRLEEALRAFCLKLSISDSLLLPVPQDCSFRLMLQVPENKQEQLSLDSSFPWIEAEPSQVEILEPHIVPLKSLKSEICNVQLYVEERGCKPKL